MVSSFRSSRLSTALHLIGITAFLFGAPSGAFADKLAGPLSDTNGDGLNELVLYDPASSTFTSANFTATDQAVVGVPASTPIVADINGDGRAEFATFNPSTGIWTSPVFGDVRFGDPGDVPVPAAYRERACRTDSASALSVRCCRPGQTGCTNPTTYAKTDLAVYNRTTGYWKIASGTILTTLRIVKLGGPGFVPVPADYDCDGYVDPAVFNRTTNQWSFKASSGRSMDTAFGLLGDVPYGADFNGDGCAEMAVYRPSESSFYIRQADGSTRAEQFGLPGDRPMILDTDGDRKADFIVLRPSNGTIYIKNASGSVVQFTSPILNPFQNVIPGSFRDFMLSDLPPDFWAGLADFANTGNYNITLDEQGLPAEVLASSIPVAVAGRSYAFTKVPGDFARSGSSSIAVVQPVDYDEFKLLYWALYDGNGESDAYFLGHPKDRPIPADYDGDGRSEAAVVSKRSDGFLEWKIKGSGGAEHSILYGLASDRAVAGDFDGDGKADKAVVRNYDGYLYWFILLAAGRDAQLLPFGIQGDQLFAADINGDGADELIAARNFAGGITWFFLSFNELINKREAHLLQWGLIGDDLVGPMDFDGDGIADFAVSRKVGGGREFYLRTSSSGPITIPFGLAEDTPLAGFFTGINRAEIAVFRRGNEDFAGQFLIRRLDGSVLSQRLGAYDSILVRPDGTIVDPFEVDEAVKAQVQASMGCNEYLGKTDGAKKGRLWKPYSESNGRTVFLLSPSYGRSVKSVEVLNRLGVVVDTMKFDGIKNGNRAHYRGRKYAHQLVSLGGKPITVRFRARTGSVQCIEFPDPRLRWD